MIGRAGDTASVCCSVRAHVCAYACACACACVSAVAAVSVSVSPFSASVVWQRNGLNGLRLHPVAADETVCETCETVCETVTNGFCCCGADDE